MTTYPFNFNMVHPSWRECLELGLAAMDANYLGNLSKNRDWLPGPEKIFNAFSIPLDQVKFVLFGESPYPRSESANGYAFWDASVHELWSETGLNKKVNRATSLRNIFKMLLVAENLLDKHHLRQENIAHINKLSLVKTNDEFFMNLLDHGFLLLNATLVLQKNHSRKQDARAWEPFIKVLLDCLLKKNSEIQFILFGQIANAITAIRHYPGSKILYAEHPYNHSFITNKTVIEFFQPLQLLRKFKQLN